VSGSLICTRALLAIRLLPALVGSGLVVATVCSWIATGKITAHRVGPRLIRVDLDEIETKIIHTGADGKRSVMINENVVELDHKPEQHESARSCGSASLRGGRRLCRCPRPHGTSRPGLP
jgi:hypothetical protein